MKKLIAALWLFLCPVTAFADDPYVVGICGTTTAPAAWSCAVEGAGDVLCENFEGAQTCGDDDQSQANCINDSWITNAPTKVNNQAAGIEGTYAKSIIPGNSGGPFAAHWLASEVDPFYGFFQFIPTTIDLETAGDYVFYSTSDGYGSPGIQKLCVTLTGGNLVWSLYCYGNATPATSSTPTITQGTTYYIWPQYSKGGTSTCSVYISSTTTKPGSPTITTTGSQTQGTGYFVLQGYNNGDGLTQLDTKFDRIRVKASAIGDDS